MDAPLQPDLSHLVFISASRRPYGAFGKGLPLQIYDLSYERFTRISSEARKLLNSSICRWDPSCSNSIKCNLPSTFSRQQDQKPYTVRRTPRGL